MAKTYQNVWTNLKPETQARLSFSTRAKGPAMATLIASLKNISSWPVGSCKDTAGPASKQRHLMASTVKKNFMARSKFKETLEPENPHWPAQSAKMCVLFEPLNKKKCPRKVWIILGCLAWPLNFVPLAIHLKKTDKKILPKLWTQKLPKEPYRKKIRGILHGWQGLVAPLVAPAVPKRGRSCQAHELL